MGNITFKTGQGTYAYDPATDRLDAVGAHDYDDNGNVLSDGERTLTWTAQNKARSLNRGGEAWSLLYDADGTRVVREEAAANAATYNLAPTYELRFGGSSLAEARISVLGATGRVVAEIVAERTELEENELWENRKSFVHDDHQGSTHTVTDHDGVVQSRVMYGPWGEARDGTSGWLSMSEAALDELPTGFTGHQPELDAGLINMRGRMYDPAVGRFMSVDPVIENALEVGTWNAYSYVQNRPLSLVDPTGMASEEPIDDEEDTVDTVSHAEGADVLYDLIVEWLELLGILTPTPITPKSVPESEITKEEVGRAVESDEAKWVGLQLQSFLVAVVGTVIYPFGLEVQPGPTQRGTRSHCRIHAGKLDDALRPEGLRPESRRRAEAKGSLFPEAAVVRGCRR